MKPIFEEERQFLSKQLNIDIPNFCWRSGNKIYVNHFSTKPVLTFKVDSLNNKLLVNKNLFEENEEECCTWDNEYEFVKEELNNKIKESKEKTKQVILNNLDYKRFVSISGGKDSDVMKDIVDISIAELIEEGYDIQNFKTQYGKHPYYNLIAFNTSNDTAQTFLYLKQHHGMNKDNIISPKKGFYKWIKEDKNYFTPSVTVRNCCSTYKEGQLTKIMNKKEKTLTFLGMRSQESYKRSFYDWDLNESYMKEKGSSNCPANWKRFLPIVKWSDVEIWMYILHNGKEFNEMYKYGFDRCGCLFCPFAKAYTDMLIKEYYPKMNERWEKILEKGYEIYNVERRLKWTKDEWVKGGKWKQSQSREYELITKKMTDERVKELAKLKNISEEMAKKYWNKKCSCDKTLNPTEVAMFLKVFGRYEDVDDNRIYMCKKCLCKKLGINQKEYKEMMIQFMNEGCNLF